MRKTPTEQLMQMRAGGRGRGREKQVLQFTLIYEKSEGKLGKARQPLAPRKPKESSGKAVYWCRTISESGAVYTVTMI